MPTPMAGPRPPRSTAWPPIVDGGVIEGAPGTAYEGLKLIWTGQGSATIDLAVSQGLADQLYNAIDEALDRSTARSSGRSTEIETTNEGFARQIERIEERASRARELLIERLAPWSPRSASPTPCSPRSAPRWTR